MRSLTFALAALLIAAATGADEPAAPPAPARIRVAGIFIHGFSVWRIDTPNCALPAGKPWLHLECGFIKCPKPKLLGIPLDLDYSNWRKSPRMTELEIEADEPFAIHFGGSLATGTIADAVGQIITGMPANVNTRACVFDAKFTPRAGGMYEATIDPREGGGCFLRLTEIRATESGRHERVEIEGAEVKACAQ